MMTVLAITQPKKCRIVFQGLVTSAKDTSSTLASVVVRIKLYYLIGFMHQPMQGTRPVVRIHKET